MLKLNCEDYPPFYKNAVETLILNLANEKNIYQQIRLFDEFSSSFTVTPDLWKLRFGLVIATFFGNRRNLNNLNENQLGFANGHLDPGNR